MKVLIATDGSDYSKAAVQECCKLITPLDNVEIKIVSIFEDVYVMSGEPFSISDEYYLKLLEAVEGQAKTFVGDAEKIVGQRLKNGAAHVRTGVTKGNPDEEIVEIAKDWGADLIVVGSHGRSFWGRMLGSVSDAVVHHAPCSVLVVRPKQVVQAVSGISP